MTYFAGFVRFCALVVVLSGYIGSASAQIEISFGPSPKAVDNLKIWSTALGADRNRWLELKNAGVSRIVIHPTFLMRYDIQLPTPGAPPLRPERTYLDANDLRNLHYLHRNIGFIFSYEASAGLASNRCSQIFVDPVVGGTRAAEVEFKHAVLPLLSARPNGVPLHELSVDGPFLRLIHGSQKRFSCFQEGVGGIDARKAALAVDAYLKRLHALVSEHPVQAGLEPEVSLLINLANWNVGGVFPRNSDPAQTDSDLLDVLSAFHDVRAANGAWPPITSIQIDYPYCYVQGISPCSTGGEEIQNRRFVGKLQLLWGATRELNEQPDDLERKEMPPPFLTLISNTYGIANACAAQFAGWPFFLPYRRCSVRPASGTDCPAGAVWLDVPNWCRQNQQETGQDFLFWAASKEFADRLNWPRGDLQKAFLNPSYAGVPPSHDKLLRSLPNTAAIKRIAFRAWGKNPVSNAWYMDRVTDYSRNR